MSIRRLGVLVAIVAGCGFCASARGAAITYSAPVTEAADTDVSTVGTSVVAFSVGNSSSLTVNGVTFASFATSGTSTTVGTTTLATSGTATFNSFSGYGPPTTAFTGSTSYGSLLSTASYVDAAAAPAPTFTITFTGLTVGRQYLFQPFVNDSRALGRSETVSGPAGSNSQTLAYDTTNIAGGAGQYTIGTFTADATSQTATITGLATGNDTQLNAFQLRLVPEPTSLGLVGVGVVGLLARRRRS